MNKSKQEIHVNADLTHNVHVIVGKPLPNGKLQVSTDRLFKNTATRLMTASIAEFLAGSEHSYNRRAGRPNFMSFGTMGIKLQPNTVDITPDTYGPVDPAHPDDPPPIVEYGNWRTYLEETFTDIVVDPEERTRPWFESTSLALTDTCGPAVLDEDGYNPHFWDTRYGWSKVIDAETGELSQDAVFQGELCTEYDNTYNVEKVKRSAILRADVSTDCPQDLEYGNDGYASTVIFYGYAPVQWVNYLLEPPNGAQLQRMAISEFGLYEKSNLDPNGMCTMFAGFRVPEIKDIVYVSKDEVILVEWRVTIRSLMPNEAVSVTDNEGKKITGIALTAVVQDKPEEDPNCYVQMGGFVRGDYGVSQDITWAVTGDHDVGTEISADGLLIIPPTETHNAVYVTGTATAAPDISSTAAIVTGLATETAYVYGIAISTEIIDLFTIRFTPTVLYVGQVNTEVTWDHPESADPDVPLDAGTDIAWDENTGIATLTISNNEQTRRIKVTVHSKYKNEIYTTSAVVRIGQTEGAYVISDFTILT